MIRRLINYLLSFLKLSKGKLFPQLPSEISDTEKLCRAIFSPINLKNGNLKSNSFRTPPGKDEVSVNRLDFTTSMFCKSEAKSNQTPPDRNYYGFAIINQGEVLRVDCITIYTPITTSGKENYFHADIKIGYIPKKGEELPSQFRKKVDDLTKKARFYKDPNLGLDTWEGENLV
jgi:hypothetical protein